MRTPKISVIVPVYKAEQYIHRCVDSLLAQTFQDFEVLLVDDGSPDRSGEICDEYAKKDSRVRVFHKENGGVSSARQCGMDNARGEYTIHADPDDWVEPEMLEELYKKAKEDDADMVICDFYIEIENQKFYKVQQPTALSAEGIISDVLSSKLMGSLCNKLMKRSHFVESNIEFPKNLNYCEDLLVCLQFLRRVNRICYLSKAYYHYDQYVNVSSITRKYVKDTYFQRRFYLTVLKNQIDVVKYSREYASQVSLVALEAFCFNVLSSSEYVKEFFKDRIYFWKSNQSLEVKIVLYLSSLGFGRFLYVIYNYIKSRRV